MIMRSKSLWGISLLFVMTVGVLVPQADSEQGEQLILIIVLTFLLSVAYNFKIFV